MSDPLPSPREILLTNFGAVASRKNRRTGTIVTAYRNSEAGFENDPTLPWSTVCEDHGTLVCHTSRALAESFIAAPDGFCDDCRALVASRAYLAAKAAVFRTPASDPAYTGLVEALAQATREVEGHDIDPTTLSIYKEVR